MRRSNGVCGFLSLKFYSFRETIIGSTGFTSHFLEKQIITKLLK